jgi:hypothetical protein
MLKAVRASIMSGVISWINSRPKVVPLSSQSATDFLLLENGDFLLQENNDKILL